MMLLNVVIALFVLVSWEHVFKLNEIDVRPTILIKNCTEPLQEIFIDVGVYFARVSSYLHYMELKEIVRTFYDLVCTILIFLLSPVWSMKGFFETAYNVYGNADTILAGGALLLSILCYIIVKYYDRIPLLKSFDYKITTNFSFWAKIRWTILFVIAFFVVLFYYVGDVLPTMNITRK